MDTLNYHHLANPFSDYDPALGSGAPEERVVIDLATAEQQVIHALTGTLDKERERRAREERRLTELAQTDELTGLPNRRGFQAEVEALIESGADLRHVALFLIDLDNFKGVNDTLGHNTGDTVLNLTGSWLAQNTRHTDETTRGVPGRRGGDEFIALIDLTPVDGDVDTDSYDAALAVGERLQASFDLEVRPHVGNKVPRFGFSMGMAFYQPGMSLDEWVDAADVSLYGAKHSSPEEQ